MKALTQHVKLAANAGMQSQSMSGSSRDMYGRHRWLAWFLMFTHVHLYRHGPERPMSRH